MSHTRIIIGMVLLVLLLIGVVVYVLMRETAQIPEAPDNAPSAPSFLLPDSGGVPIALESIEADLRIINFWASWSSYSREELLALARLQKEHKDRLAVIAVNRDTNSDEGKAFLVALGLSNELTFVFDEGDTYYREVGGANMPETLLLDRNARVLLHTRGPMNEEELERVVRDALFTQ